MVPAVNAIFYGNAQTRCRAFRPRRDAWSRDRTFRIINRRSGAMHVRKRVFEVGDDLVFRLNRVCSALVRPRIARWFFPEYASTQEKIVGCDMFELLGERAHTLELARRRRKTVLFRRHGF